MTTLRSLARRRPVVDSTGLLRATLLRRRAPGAVVCVIATDPAVPLDLPARCHLTGHHYLGPASGTGRAVYALRLAADAHLPSPDAPRSPAAQAAAA